MNGFRFTLVFFFLFWRGGAITEAMPLCSHPILADGGVVVTSITCPSLDSPPLFTFKKYFVEQYPDYVNILFFIKLLATNLSFLKMSRLN